MSTEISELRATAHPVRLRMLSLLTGTAMSAAELAREIGISHPNASYHVRLLAEAGLVRPEGEVRIRGGVAKRYRHVGPLGSPDAETSGDSGKPGGSGDSEKPAAPHGAAEGEVSSAEERVRVWQSIAYELIRRARHQAAGRSVLCDAELWVDDETWQRACSLAHEAADLLHRNARPQRSKGSRSVDATIAMFPMRRTR